MAEGQWANALIRKLRQLAKKWREERAHTYASENADYYRGFDAGRQASAKKLLSVIREHLDD